MKKTRTHLAWLTATLLLASPGLRATIIVDDTFDVGTPTIGDDAGDPKDIAWVAAFNNTAVTVKSTAFAPGTGNYIENDVSSGFSMIRGSLPVDSALTLGIGDTILLSFDFSFSEGSQNAGNGFRFGLFDSTGLGTSVAAGVGTGNTTLSIGQDTSATINGDMASGANGFNTLTGTGDSQANGTLDSILVNDVSYRATLSILRLSSDTLSISASLNGGVATATDFNNAGINDYLTDFSGGYIVIRNGNITRDFRVDNVNVSVIPEPGTLALVGLSLLALLFLRRR